MPPQILAHANFPDPQEKLILPVVVHAHVTNINHWSCYLSRNCIFPASMPPCLSVAALAFLFPSTLLVYIMPLEGTVNGQCKLLGRVKTRSLVFTTTPSLEAGRALGSGSDNPMEPNLENIISLQWWVGQSTWAMGWAYGFKAGSSRRVGSRMDLQCV